MLKPMGNLLLISKIQEAEKTTKTGLVISSAISNTGPAMGKVVDMGEGEYNYKGDLIPVLGVDIGDIVYFPDHSSTDIEDEDGTKYLLVSSKNVLAVKSS